MDKVTIIVRDEVNPNMHFVVSNDAGCSYTFWRKPEDFLPDTDGWVLANIRPVRYGNAPQESDYLALANYDGVEWRTQSGRTPADYKVMEWCALPTPEDAAFYAAS